MSLYDYTEEGMDKLWDVVDAYFEGIGEEDPDADDTFLGYCVDKQGMYTPAVTLNGVQEVVKYCNLQSMLHYEIRITDVCDSIVMQTINGVIVWPEDIKGLDVSELSDKVDAKCTFKIRRIGKKKFKAAHICRMCKSSIGYFYLNTGTCQGDLYLGECNFEPINRASKKLRFNRGD